MRGQITSSFVDTSSNLSFHASNRQCKIPTFLRSYNRPKIHFVLKGNRTKINIVKISIKEALERGVQAHQNGNRQGANRYYSAILKSQPHHPEANHNMGVLCYEIGKYQQALNFFKVALTAMPNTEQYWLSYIDTLISLDRIDDAMKALELANNRGLTGAGFNKLKRKLNSASYQFKSIRQSTNTPDPAQNQSQHLINLYNGGMLQDALTLSGKLVRDYPRSAVLFNIRGHILHALNEYELSVESYKKAISVMPDQADAYSNMSASLNKLGKYDEAELACRKAISLTPDLAESYNNLGNSLQARSFFADAAEAYRKALSIQPAMISTYSNLASVLTDMGEFHNAIEICKEAISMQPDNKIIYVNLARAIKNVSFEYFDADIENAISTILDYKSLTSPEDIARAAISMLKCDPELKPLFNPKINSILNDSFSEVLSAVASSTLLLKLMSVCPLPDIETERALSAIRSFILTNISKIRENDTLLKVQSALALQCFTNEYIYELTKGDETTLSSLEAVAEKLIRQGTQPKPQLVLCLASFKALKEYPWSNLIKIEPRIEGVIKRQLTESNEETTLKSGIEILGEITDKTSKRVRKQYEENPYPRWVNLGIEQEPINIFTLVNRLKLKLCNTNILNTHAPKILIAGCGTGSHSITTATRLKNSKVLAVDVSLSSLSYAIRKTRELRISNVDHLQADILQLHQLGRQFDIIESCGVLHHMKEPLIGWHVLTDILKSGGLLKIALYSELARQHIAKIREEIKSLGINASQRDMRSFRVNIAASDKKHHQLILNSDDFYSLSSMRDLIFNVQEHRFTIPQISECLETFGLEFCGFEADWIVNKFNSANPSKNAVYDLTKWHAFEEDHPDSFAGMYQFWCQKR